MIQLYEINVELSETQKRILFSAAYRKRKAIVLRLNSYALTGTDTLHAPKNIVNRQKKNHNLTKGIDVLLAKTNIRRRVTGSLLTTI